MKSTWTIDYHKGGFGDCSILLGGFVKRHHYSKSLCRGTKYIFAILEGKRIIGVAAFGTPVGRHCQSKYSKTGQPVLELKRLCLIDDTPKNSESWFIGQCLRQLKSTREFDGILSYADPKMNHEGIIYKASNFSYLGRQRTGSTKTIIDGKRISAASAKAKKLNALNQRPKLVYDKPKHIFYYGFKR